VIFLMLELDIGSEPSAVPALKWTRAADDRGKIYAAELLDRGPRFGRY